MHLWNDLHSDCAHLGLRLQSRSPSPGARPCCSPQLLLLQRISETTCALIVPTWVFVSRADLHVVVIQVFVSRADLLLLPHGQYCAIAVQPQLLLLQCISETACALFVSTWVFVSRADLHVVVIQAFVSRADLLLLPHGQYCAIAVQPQLL